MKNEMQIRLDFSDDSIVGKAASDVIILFPPVIHINIQGREERFVKVSDFFTQVELNWLDTITNTASNTEGGLERATRELINRKVKRLLELSK